MNDENRMVFCIFVHKFQKSKTFLWKNYFLYLTLTFIFR